LFGAELRSAACTIGAWIRALAADRQDANYGNAPAVLADAMVAHPEMVSGDHRSDLALMRAGRGDWVTKIGAEGLQAIESAAKASGSPSRSSTAASGDCIRRPSRPSTS
jgi:L-asparaginase II